MNPINIVLIKQQKSKIFFVSPNSFLILKAVALTIPSPGLGMICISTVNAAPTPVQNTPNNKTMTCKGKESTEKDNIAANKFINLVNTILNGICSTTFQSFSKTYSATTSIQYQTNVAFPKFMPVIPEKIYAIEIIGETPKLDFVFNVRPSAKIIIPKK